MGSPDVRTERVWRKAVRIAMVSNDLTYKKLQEKLGVTANYLKLLVSRDGKYGSQLVIKRVSEAVGVDPALCTYYKIKGD